MSEPIIDTDEISRKRELGKKSLSPGILQKFLLGVALFSAGKNITVRKENPNGAEL